MVIVYVVVVIRGTDQKTFKSVPMSKAGSTMLKNKNLLTPIKLVDKLRVLGSDFRTFQTPVLHWLCSSASGLPYLIYGFLVTLHLIWK